MIDKKQAERQALQLIAADGRGVTPRLAALLGVTSQSANLHVQSVVKQGLVLAEGQTKARRYRLATLAEDKRSYPCAGLSEDQVWQELFVAQLADLPENVRGIWHHGVTEMVNNAIDHSGSAALEVGLRRNALHTDAWVADSGIGIFAKIQKAMDLFDPREAILELSKGKLTTDPRHHSGEGIFFTSKIFDEFDIVSGRLHFRHDDRPFDILAERKDDAPGTLVMMRLDNHSERLAKAVFDQFAAPEEYSFSKTLIPVRLAQYEGEALVSRSQAKRLYRRFEKFQHIILDFEGVAEIGQAFADELFRVFAAEHPKIELAPIKMSAAVEQMVKRARNAAAQDGEASR